MSSPLWPYMVACDPTTREMVAGDAGTSNCVRGASFVSKRPPMKPDTRPRPSQLREHPQQDAHHQHDRPAHQQGGTEAPHETGADGQRESTEHDEDERH